MANYPNPAELFKGPLGDWLTELKEERERAQLNSRLRLFITAPLAAIAFLYGVIELDGSLEAKLFAGTVAAGGIYRWSQAPKRGLVTTIKATFNTAIANAMGLTYHDYGYPNFAFECAEHFRLFPAYHSCEMEDQWEGEFDGKHFDLMEVELKAWVKSGKKRKLRGVFTGSLLSFTPSFSFKATTLIREKNSTRSWRETYIEGVDGPPTDLGLYPVEIAQHNFSARFECYSADTKEALAIVDRRVINQLLKIEDRFGGSGDIAALLHDGHFILAFNGGNMFETGSIDPDDDYRKVETTIEQFAFIADITKAI